MENLLSTAGGTAAAIAAFLTAALAFLKSPIGKWLWHRNVRQPVQEFLRTEIDGAVRPITTRLDVTAEAFEAHMIEEGKRLAVEAEHDEDAANWRVKVDEQLEDGLIRFDRIEVTQKRVEGKIDALVARDP